MPAARKPQAAKKPSAKATSKKAPSTARAVGKPNTTASRFELAGPLYPIYTSVPYLSYKHSSYFQVYEKCFTPFINKPITFIEVGVLNGGSLFMWRKFFGPNARIIGVDFNPGAKKWEKDGFEIHIGDQSSPVFWAEFFHKVGPVDILLDDGGHTNRQQIETVMQALPHIRDGGLIMVEDTHASYMPEFGNPSFHSFTNFAKSVTDKVNSRFPAVKGHESLLRNRVFSTEFYESIVVFNIDSRRAVIPLPLSNEGESSDAQDFRHQHTTTGTLLNLEVKAAKMLAPLKREPFITLKHMLFKLIHRAVWEADHLKTRRYFK
ncbi:MAG: class I SAM-dependent methyltransferase [Alphaproteobacteria bacterium]|nr:MAG: class I SAM-dependent methyltransferase [Alphaproteobacteria bacterium]